MAKLTREDRELQKVQDWTCEAGHHGKVFYDDEEGAYAVIDRIRASHWRRAPACRAAVSVRDPAAN